MDNVLYFLLQSVTKLLSLYLFFIIKFEIILYIILSSCFMYKDNIIYLYIPFREYEINKMRLCKYISSIAMCNGYNCKGTDV